MTSPHVFDVTVANFEADVIRASEQAPVLVDFWADWCGPCKTLGPVLESLADEYGGAFRLGKCDVEAEQQLGAMFQIQSIPTCILLVGGRPADGFQGALPEAELRKFLSGHGIEPAEAGEPEEEADPDTPEQRLKTGLAAAQRGDVAAVRERLESIGEEEPEHARAARILAGIAIYEAPSYERGHAAAPTLDQGRERMEAGDFEGAVESFLESMTQDKGFADELARRASVLCFEFLGVDEQGQDIVAGFRRRMATLLY